MLKYLPHVLLFVFLFLFGANPVMSEDKQGPKAVIKESEFNFKEVKQGETIEHTFKVQNQGDMPLKILNVRPG